MSPEGKSSRIGFNEAMTHPEMTWEERGLMVNSAVAGLYAGIGAGLSELAYRVITHQGINSLSGLEADATALAVPAVVMAGMAARIAYGRGWLHKRQAQQNATCA